MKKISLLSLVLSITMLSLVSSTSTNAASQTIRLNPTSVAVGTSKATFIDPNQTPPPPLVSGGEIQNPNNALIEDGQVAFFNPVNFISGAPNNSDSYLYVDYQKNSICEQAVITSVVVHARWSQATSTEGNPEPDQFDVAAGLFLLNDPTQLNYSFNLSTFAYTVNEQAFGGLIPPTVYNGSPPSTLTHEFAPVQTLPTLSQLNNPNTRIYVTLGENPGGRTGELDSTWLEVTYDDSACTTPPPVVVDPPATVAPPKTGTTSITVVLISTLIALGGIILMARTILTDKKKSAK